MRGTDKHIGARSKKRAVALLLIGVAIFGVAFLFPWAWLQWTFIVAATTCFVGSYWLSYMEGADRDA